MKTEYIIAGLCMVVIPVVNRVRYLLSLCCHVTRKLESRRNMSHTNTITSTIWDKSRKVSDMGLTAVTNVDMELDVTSPKSKKLDVLSTTTIFKNP